MSWLDDPNTTTQSTTSFTWLEDGAFVIQHSSAPHPFPTSNVAVIGRDDEDETFTMLYTDSRGVSRIYQMSVKNGVWKIWRAAPGFSQRFTGTFSADGQRINATSEKSTDNATWERDFNLTYTKIR